MESVEVWMWVIAGLILGGIVFVGGFKLLGNYVHSTEVSIAAESSTLLYTMVNNVCFGGRGEREVKSLVFPSMVERIYVEDEFGVQGEGKLLCYDLENDEPTCLDLKACGITMDTISMAEEKTIFSAVAKFLGKKNYQRFRFSVNKEDFDDVSVTWKREILTDS